MLKLQFLHHLMGRANSLEKTLMPGKIEGRRRRGQQRINGITNSMDMNLSKLLEIVKDMEAWSAIVQGVAKSGKWLRDWTTILVPAHLYSCLFSQATSVPTLWIIYFIEQISMQCAQCSSVWAYSRKKPYMSLLSGSFHPGSVTNYLCTKDGVTGAKKIKQVKGTLRGLLLEERERQRSLQNRGIVQRF